MRLKLRGIIKKLNGMRIDFGGYYILMLVSKRDVKGGRV